VPCPVALLKHRLHNGVCGSAVPPECCRPWALLTAPPAADGIMLPCPLDGALGLVCCGRPFWRRAPFSCRADTPAIACSAYCLLVQLILLVCSPAGLLPALSSSPSASGVTSRSKAPSASPSYWIVCVGALPLDDEGGCLWLLFELAGIGGKV
jgi:hypothetical protein